MKHFNRILIANLALASAAFAGEQDSYRNVVRTIHPYTAFTNGYATARISSGAPISTRENYTVFIRLAAESYREEFSLAEIQKIAEFYDSPLGKRLMEHALQSDLTSDFLKAIDPQSYPDITTVWTCPDHPQIRTPSDGKCPICMKPLQEQQLEK